MTRENMFKKIVAWLICAVMIIGMIPNVSLPASAETTDDDWEGDIDVVETEPPAGSEENPIDLTFVWADDGLSATAVANVPAGKTYYYTVYANFNGPMTISGPAGFSYIVGENAEPDVDGEIATTVSLSFMMPASIAIENETEADGEYTFTLTVPVGSQGNPDTAIDGDNVASIEAGNNQGYYYTYTAAADGHLTVTISTAAAGWSYTINNLTTYSYGYAQYSNSDPVVNPAVVAVSAGDELQIIVNTYDPDDQWNNPKGNVTVNIVAAEHTYQYDCSTECSVCGEGTREAEHVYYYPCDPVCMICYEITNPDAAHNIVPVEAVEATCTTNGNIAYWYCSDCGAAWADEALTQVTNRFNVVVPAPGHDYVAETTPADCENDGKTVYTCSVCGDSYEEVIPAGHTYTDDCDLDCDVCGEYRDAPHNLTTYVEAVVPANCQETGHPEYWICADCGGYFRSNGAGGYYETNPAWINYTGDHVRPEGAAACAVVKCELCGEDSYGTESCVRPDGDPECLDSTCVNCSEIVYGWGHSYGYDENDNQIPLCQAGTCIYCNEEFEYIYEHENGAWAACQEGECSYGCGKTYPATANHTLENCAEGGYCSVCWSYVEACEHTYEYDCSAECSICSAGTREAEHVYFYPCDPVCMICYEITNPDATHNIVPVEAVDATCIENGNIAYWYCSDCGSCWADEALTQVTNRMSIVVPATGEHNYVDGVCSVCGEADPDYVVYTVTFGDTIRNSANFVGAVELNQYSDITFSDNLTQEYIFENGGLLAFDGEVSEEEAIIENCEKITYGLKLSNGLYGGTTAGIPAAEYGKALTLRLFVKLPNGEVVYGGIKSYSVQQYCEGRISSASSAQTMKNLAAATLHYGAMAQINFDKDVDNLANSNLPAEYAQDAFAYDASYIDALNEDATFALAGTGTFAAPRRTLNFVGAVEIVHQFQPQNIDNMAKIEMLVWKNVSGELDEADADVITMEDAGSGWYKANTAGIPAAEYGYTFILCAKVTDTDGNTYYSDLSFYSPETYAANQIAKTTTSENTKNVCMAMVVFGQMAKIHFGK